MMRILLASLWAVTALTAPAAINVAGGHLVVANGYLVELGAITVSSGAFLDLNDPAVVQASPLVIEAGGTVQGDGIIDGDLLNDGTLLGNGGATLTVTGTTTNNGTVRMANQTTLDIQGGFHNVGLLDLIMSPSAPPELDGEGTVLTANTLPPVSVSIGTQADLFFTAYPGHRYMVLKTSNLAAPDSWTAVGNAFSVDTVSSIEFSDPDISTNAVMFYRYQLLD